MNFNDFQRIQTRRYFFKFAAGGIETIALAHLLGQDGRTAQKELPDVNPQAPRAPHFAPKAKNVIFLLQAGGPSQIDLYDPKPELQKRHGQVLPESMTKGRKFPFISPSAKVLGSPRKFRKYGESGADFSDYIPHMASRADDIALIRSMHTEAVNHHPGQAMLMSGTTMSGRPTVGSWVSYGLGSEANDLPAFVVLNSGRGASAGSTNWSNGFLPSTYQGVNFRGYGDPILYLKNPPGISNDSQRARIDAIRELNENHYQNTGDLEIAARIHSYEMAFRMQTAAPELLDFSNESQAVLDSFGVGKEPTNAYGTNCLLARRMIERGVRFVLLVHASWDQHENLDEELGKHCDATDAPVGALLGDLKQRGLLDETMVVWGGEFGRTPLGEFEREFDGEAPGRDHHPGCFSMWVAGGGIQGGQVIGRTDDIGFNITEDPVHIHDLQATILHALGLDHTQLTYSFMGRDFRLTDVGGNVVKKLFS